MIKHPSFICSLFDNMKPMVLPNIFSQLMRFGLVGITAAALHYAVVILLVQLWGMQLLLANIFGFAGGMQISYFGHRYFTFNDTASVHRSTYSKMILLQAINFLVNEYLFYIFLVMHLPYQLALFIVLAIMPIFTFFVSRFWVFSYS